MGRDRGVDCIARPAGTRTGTRIDDHTDDSVIERIDDRGIDDWVIDDHNDDRVIDGRVIERTDEPVEPCAGAAADATSRARNDAGATRGRSCRRRRRDGAPR